MESQGMAESGESLISGGEGDQEMGLNRWRLIIVDR